MKKLFFGSLAVAALVAGLAWGQAQVAPPFAVVPIISTLNQNDAVQVVPRGQPQVGNSYANPGVVGGIQQYQYVSPAAGFQMTVTNGTSFLILSPSGTLATGILTMAAAPSDGQKFCLFETQTQTAITIAANTGQTMAFTNGGFTNPPAALASNQQYCWQYVAPQATWIRVN